jgi:hypothetical protein
VGSQGLVEEGGPMCAISVHWRNLRVEIGLVGGVVLALAVDGVIYEP